MSTPSELVLLLLRIGFLLLLWFFVFGVIYSLRADLFGMKVRKLPAEATAGAPAPAPAAAPVASRPASAKASTGPATIATAKRLVITSGPKAGLELPLGTDTLTIGRSSESALVIRDDYTSSHHARLMLRGDSWAIQDLDSTNGTFVAGQRVTGGPVGLALGTPIKVGATTFELRA
ncbi:FHA domain-containing protein [Microbacterium foliorum]|uniref:FHA domain-containing protein FhaB n=1 Tax=Microbacterium foliorum TaxID=104336 RepID=A0A0F0KMV0_9MICO|nr:MULTISPECIES: FHA domain-containing protein [Microbacterium]AXL10729.1 FHA domain-containing protein [Microbacterium foliorum]KAA0962008.1 FHA domain-containing protein [Microbacterium sp. ANT_H45B]KJL21764.1 FHA domain-containing protein FhaB [Microbacterium foliorum]MCP1428371.1 pSer/pThr/pTyr-binding forkhead associated (FHA) protein [Microbacterium foliorum]CAH0184442.1 FHA domain-containing protein FhaB [Microbacterium foliorum]